MSITYCHACDQRIDEDFNVEHYETIEHLHNVAMMKLEQIIKDAEEIKENYQQITKELQHG